MPNFDTYGPGRPNSRGSGRCARRQRMAGGGGNCNRQPVGGASNTLISRMNISPMFRADRLKNVLERLRRRYRSQSDDYPLGTDTGGAGRGR